MDGNQTTAGAGPAPFLLKTYEMVDDSVTDEIVSWSTKGNSFVVWNPPEFARHLLPTYFKHNNFSSFIRQLNTYGFRKIDPERWEFANEEFMKDKKHILKNIHRKKPIHSHSNNPQSGTIDPEKAAFNEEIDKLTREKNSLEKNISRFKQQQPTTKLQLEDLTQRVSKIEQKQDTLLSFLKKASQNPGFVELLAQKLESMDFSADNKKRRLPRSQVFPDDNHSPSRPDFGNVFQHDFSNKLRLELSPAASDVNFCNSTQSSNEDGGSPQMILTEDGTRPQELIDTCTSFGFNMESCYIPKTGPSLDANEESEDHLSCQLNLSLASCVSQNQINPSQDTDSIPEPEAFEQDGPAPANVQARVNDVFWEQFLTERPGSLDGSKLRSKPSHEQEDRRSGQGSYGNSRNLQNLTL